MSQSCLCCSGLFYHDCCEPLHLGEAQAESAVALMRSRYCAFVRTNIDYIAHTQRDQAAKNFSASNSRLWAATIVWQRLDVLRAQDLDGTTTTVEFKAYYVESGIEKCMHEHSLFKNHGGQWFYVGSQKSRLTNASASRVKKVGRNDPCPCDSGKKYKKCCG